MEKTLFGLVFRVNNQIFLTQYLGHNNFTDGSAITNHKPYKTLREDQLSFVRIVNERRPDGRDACILTDLQYITVGNEFRKDCKAYEILLNTGIRDEVSNYIEQLITKHSQ